MISLRGRRPRRSRAGVRLVIAGILLVAGAVPAGGAVLRVDVGASGAETGASWSDAFTDLQDALDAASPGDEIWVATGVYRPDRGTKDRAASFQLETGVAIHGGFAGVESDRAQRDIGRNPTVLSGDLKGDDIPLENPQDRFIDSNRLDTYRSDNSFNVVRAIGVEESAVLDGFTIRGGQAADRYSARTIVGAAMFIADGNPTIRNCTFVDNGAVQSGGAVAIEDASPTFVDCVFERNAANRQGGAVEVRRGSPRFERCVFQGNFARWGGAGVYLVNAQQPEFIDCRFEENIAQLGGGGLQSEADRDDGRLALRKCTFINNVAGHSGGGLSVSRGQVTLTACSLLGNAASDEGGGLVAADTNVTMIDSVISGNDTESGRGSELACDAHATIRLTGDGVVSPGFVGTILIDGTLVVAGRMRITSGDFIVGQLGAMILMDEAQVELGDNGSIDAAGTLQATDQAVLSFTTILVRSVTFDGDAIVSNNVITAEAGAGFGQFFVDGRANVVDNEIRSDGDRYLDVDVRGFGGVIDAMRIFVRITEGIGTERGALFELRGEDRFPECSPDSFVCGLGPDGIPAFDETTWTLEQLELAPGAKLNLTNRFDFNNGGSSEVLYVKRLIIGKGAVLNTGFHRVYYGTLEGSGDIVHNPLQGFPLGVIRFNDENEFIVRIASNNDDGVNDDGTIGQSRIHVRRVVSQLPDPNGMMQMETRLDKRTGAVVHARAKGWFGRKGDHADAVWIWFRYLFDEPGGTLIVSLSEDPDVGEGNLEIARRTHPPAGEPGSLGSHEFTVFRALVKVGDREFRRGVQVERELAGPEGVRVLIDDFDPFECSTEQCGDITADRIADIRDVGAAVSEIGQAVSLDASASNLQCAAHPLIQTGYIDLFNAQAYAGTSGLEIFIPCE